MRVLVTGHEGFIGRNLVVRLSELPGMFTMGFGSGDSAEELVDRVANADAIVHLAGVNRPERDSAFSEVNTGLTERMIEAARRSGRAAPIIFASSLQATLDNPYGRSKLTAEERLRAYADATGVTVHIFRLPNVFGKWCRPGYNSVVATFCHNIARGLDVRVDNPAHALTLVHVDDVIDTWLTVLSAENPHPVAVAPEYRSTVGELEKKIRSFRNARRSLITERVGTGFDRALYSTYISYLPPAEFAYRLPMHADSRGAFVEFMKTRDSGQFSFFVARPGVTRGGHYHHTKTEKFLVLQGYAKFRFRHIVSNQTHEVSVAGEVSEVVETAPGWAHDITNVGDDDLVVMVWANEVFDRDRPDTIASPFQ